MKKLRDLLEEYGANGVIYVDDGNGSAGPSFIACGPDASDEDNEGREHLMDISMTLTPATDRCYDAASSAETIGDVARDVLPDYNIEAGKLWASDWIEDDERNAPYQAANPYRYRLIF